MKLWKLHKLLLLLCQLFTAGTVLFLLNDYREKDGVLSVIISFLCFRNKENKLFYSHDAPVSICSVHSLQTIHNMRNKWIKETCTCSATSVAKSSMYSLKIVLFLAATSEIPVTRK
jgi:hypothetical protein